MEVPTAGFDAAAALGAAAAAAFGSVGVGVASASCVAGGVGVCTGSICAAPGWTLVAPVSPGVDETCGIVPESGAACVGGATVCAPDDTAVSDMAANAAQAIW